MTGKPNLKRPGLQAVLTAAVGTDAKGAEIDRAWINGANASRKADREALAMAFTAIAKARGATVDRHDRPINLGYHGQSIALAFRTNGVGALLDIDNLHGGDHSLIHWYNTEYPSRNFSTRFCVFVGSSTAYRPHHKATSCGADWYSLAMQLDSGLCLAARDEAFEPSK